MKSRHRRKLISDLNLTNLIDVMLTLLIIFMITAPMMTQGVQVDLPPADAKNVEVSTSIQVTIDSHHELYIDEERVFAPTISLVVFTMYSMQGPRSRYLSMPTRRFPTAWSSGSLPTSRTRGS